MAQIHKGGLFHIHGLFKSMDWNKRVLSCARSLGCFRKHERRKDSPLIAGKRSSQLRTIPPYRWNMWRYLAKLTYGRVISHSALMLSARAPGRAGLTHKRSRPITAKLQIDREVVWVRDGRSWRIPPYSMLPSRFAKTAFYWTSNRMWQQI